YHETLQDRTQIAGGNALMRLTHLFSQSSDISLQIYFDRTERHDAFLQENRNTFDIDFQHRFGLSWWQELIWGLGFRSSSDDISGSSRGWPNPDREDQTVDLASAFVHSNTAIVEDRLRLTLGCKFEHNDFTDFEIQPTGRLAWLPDKRHTVWGAVSRAVRTPSPIEHDAIIPWAVVPPGTPENPNPFPMMLTLYGGPQIESEELIAYEAGYRFRPCEQLSMELAAFYNVYDKLRTFDAAQAAFDTIPSPYILVPLHVGNVQDGETYGIEISAEWNPWDWVNLRAGYSRLQMELRLPAGSTAQPVTDYEDSNPQNQLFIHNMIDILPNLEFDVCVRYIDELPHHKIDAYTAVDARIGWMPHNQIELALVGRDLLDASRGEYASEMNNSHTLVQRSVYGLVTWRF
ncbi:MAG: TonB-dependent receptor, partial [Candidatus Eisenbacteria sp.]|nr:TonB-dependent receptor [Candidatus Eisenbacteria bacterium]